MSRLLTPLVAYAVSDLSEPIVDAMSVVNALTVTPDGTPGFVTAEPVLPVDVLPQAAATSAAPPTRVTRLNFDRPWDPRPLIPSCKRIRPLPSEPESTVCDATCSGSDKCRHPNLCEAACGWFAYREGFVNSSNEKSP